jgi:hypothetical protein
MRRTSLLFMQMNLLLDLFESSLFILFFCQYILNYICIVYNIELLITDLWMTRVKASTSKNFSFVVAIESHIFMCTVCSANKQVRLMNTR